MKLVPIVALFLVGCSLTSASVGEVALTDKESSEIKVLGDRQEEMNREQSELNQKSVRLQADINSLAFRLKRAHNLPDDKNYRIDIIRGKLTEK